ncbi:MAG TPA: glycosyltransferase family 2 protein [Thermoplasmata archaeon]|nr:glycosyltransferase family 2 protein [Thermoplasmata archaeon]
MHPKVSIIILNWNGWKDTIECLESVYQITYPNYDVILIDNGSEDESIEKIKEYCEGKIKVNSKFFEYSILNKPINFIEYNREEAEAGGGKEEEIADLPSNRKLILIKNEKNYGFAEGNNIGMRYAMKILNPDYILLLNNDTVVEKKFLDELIKVAESDEKIGVVGPKIYYYDESKKIQFAGGKINWLRGETKEIGRDKIEENQYNKIKEVDYVTGCAFLMRRELVEQIGFFDPIYFLYFEETDFCVRCKKKRFKLIYIPTSKIWHKIAQSTGGEFSPIMAYYFVRNRYIFMKKHGRKNIIKWSMFLLSYHIWIFQIIWKNLEKRDVVRSIIKGYRDALFRNSFYYSVCSFCYFFPIIFFLG